MRKIITKYFDIIEEMLFIPLNSPNKEVKKIFGATNSIKQQIKKIIGTSKGYVYDRVKHSKHRVIPKEAYRNCWFYSGTQNNVHALLPLYNEIQVQKLFVSLGKDNSHQKTKITGLRFPPTLSELAKALIICMLFVIKNKNARPLLAQSFKAVVTLFECRKIIKHFQPKVIFFANDHGINSRAMLIAGREERISTIYLQHACVSNIFPPLGYSIALLDGRDASEKYKVLKEVNCRKFEVGMIKFDQYKVNRNFSGEIKNVCICVNLLDDEDVVIDLAKAIMQQFPSIAISIRFHPRYNIQSSRLYDLDSISFSDKNENAFDFLARQDVCISGNSSIHLEAVLMNVISIQYDFDVKHDLGDYYGFVKNALVLKANSPHDVLTIIKQYEKKRPSDWFRRANYYVQNNEGCTSALQNVKAVLKQEVLGLFE